MTRNAICMIIVLKLFVFSACTSETNESKEVMDYPNLSENLSKSENYEIKKIINGPGNTVLYVPEINMILVQGEEYLWKIDERGYVADTIKRQGNMFGSGLSFHDDYFIDWVYSGNKQKQNYSEMIDANLMTEEELTTYFDTADIIEFEYRRHQPLTQFGLE